MASHGSFERLNTSVLFQDGVMYSIRSNSAVKLNGSLDNSFPRHRRCFVPSLFFLSPVIPGEQPYSSPSTPSEYQLNVFSIAASLLYTFPNVLFRSGAY